MKVLVAFLLIILIGCSSVDTKSAEWTVLSGQISTLVLNIAENEEALANGDLSKKAIIIALRKQLETLIADLKKL